MNPYKCDRCGRNLAYVNAPCLTCDMDPRQGESEKHLRESHFGGFYWCSACGKTVPNNHACGKEVPTSLIKLNCVKCGKDMGDAILCHECAWKEHDHTLNLLKQEKVDDHVVEKHEMTTHKCRLAKTSNGTCQAWTTVLEEMKRGGGCWFHCNGICDSIGPRTTACPCPEQQKPVESKAEKAWFEYTKGIVVTSGMRERFMAALKEAGFCE